MANAVINPSIIAKEALFQLENNLVMANAVHRDYEKEFVKVGSTINIRRPVKFTAVDGATISKQDVEEAGFAVSIDKQKHVAWEFTSQTLTLTIEEYSERYIQPAMIALAEQCDADGCAEYQRVYNTVSLGSFANPSTFANMAVGAIRLDNMAVPPSGRTRMSKRRAVMHPAAAWSVAGAQAAIFHQQKVSEAFSRGEMGDVAGFLMMNDQNVAAHTVGVATGTPLINGASQNVTYAASKTSWSQSLITDGWTNSITGILKAGDVFTIAGVNAVNPKSGASLGYLQQFTVLADANSGATTGPATLTVSPPIITSGAYKTVSAAPADNAAITVLGTGGTTYREPLLFHKNAFALVSRPLELPDGVAFKARASHRGLSVRIVKDYDITNDKDVIRCDILYGWDTVYPELACRYRTVNG